MRKTKVYIYTRVSTAMQIDGYSLDAQKSRMKTFCEYNDYEIVGEYEDAGKSGKSVEGRPAFKQMLQDIENGLTIDVYVSIKAGYAINEVAEKIQKNIHQMIS